MQKNPASDPRQTKSFMPWVLPSITSGVLLGIAFPPLDLTWLVWFGLAPLLWVSFNEPRRAQAFFSGFIAGLLFWLINLRPLVSAYLWSGWQDDIDLDAALNQQFIALNILWVLIALWASIFWGLFTFLLSRLVRGSLPGLAILAPPLFILTAEWLRALTTWDYQWAMLGNAAADYATIRQLAAFGSTWLLTWMIVLVNAAVLTLVLSIRKPVKWALATTLLVVISALWGAAYWQQASTNELIEGQPSLPVAALQYHQAEYHFNDYAAIGIEKDYLQLLYRIARGEAGPVALLVLPESIAISTVSLDGTRTPKKPDEVQIPLSDWNETILGVIDESRRPFSMVVGVDTVENEKLHNSLLFWSPMGIQQSYHKQKLVPFSEYSPPLMHRLGLQGESAYQSGNSSALTNLENLIVGGFICQEVQIPAVIRRSVLDGTQLLVSGGNDGVFADPAVAQVHAKIARLRAVESGRYIVRAMKTGISAIIDPSGKEIAQSPGSEPHIVTGQVHRLSHQTPYIRFGDWPLVLASLIVLTGLLRGHLLDKWRFIRHLHQVP